MAETIEVPIVQKRQLDENIVEVTCQLNENNISFKAGQHIRVTLPSLSFPDEKGKNRTFNILSSPNNSEYLSFAFVNSDSGFKKTITALPDNSQIQLTGPFGMFTLPGDSRDLVFISEGIGIVPVISMILYLTEESAKNKITLIHYDSKNTPYKDDLNALKNANNNITLHTKLGSLSSDFITKTISNFNGKLFFVSGKPETISHVKPLLLQQNVPIVDIKTEEFAGY